MAGVKMVHVPYKGSGESQAATLAGHVDLTFFAFSTALRHVKAGKLRAVGVGGGKRNPQAPDVPSISEVLPGYSAASWTDSSHRPTRRRRSSTRCAARWWKS